MLLTVMATSLRDYIIAHRAHFYKKKRANFSRARNYMPFERRSNAEHLDEFLLVDDLNAEFFRLFQLASGSFSGDDEVDLGGHAVRDLSASLLDQLFRLGTGEPRERPGQHDLFAAERALRPLFLL